MLQLTDCLHCKKTGTCESGGKNGESCKVCIAFWKGEFGNNFLLGSSDPIGLKCSTCWGKGVTEPSGRTKWDYRTPAALAGGLSILSFLLLWLTYNGGEAFNKALVFVGTLLGSITGYYFGGAKPSDNSAVIAANGSGTNAPATPAPDPAPAPNPE